MPRHRSMVSSLFVRNVPNDARADELREIFSKYGPVTDVYIPLDYYTRQHRGFAYIQFEDYRDADDALYYLKGFKYCGVELEIEFARSDRKTPHMMRMREKGGGGSGGRNDDYDDYDRRRRGGARRSYSRSPKRDRRSYSRSRSPSYDRKKKSRRHRSRESSTSSHGAKI